MAKKKQPNGKQPLNQESLDKFFKMFDTELSNRVNDAPGKKPYSQKASYNPLVNRVHKDVLEVFEKDSSPFNSAEKREISKHVALTQKNGATAYYKPKEKKAPKENPIKPPKRPPSVHEKKKQRKAKNPTNSKKPPIGETKVENTTNAHKETVEKKSLNANVVKSDVPNTANASRFLQKNRGKIALGAIGVGIAHSWIDGEDDDVFSATGKGIKTGLVATGAAVAGQHLLKTETMQDLVKGEVVQKAKEVSDDAALKGKMLRAQGIKGTAVKIGLIAVGAATVLDLGQKGKDRLDSAKLQRDQEVEMEKRRMQSKKKSREQAYGAMDNGEIVFDLFNARTGHHKMGNAKFN